MSALENYVTAKNEIRELLKKLCEADADNYGDNLDAINWAHVGNLNHIKAELSELVEFVALDDNHKHLAGGQ